MNAFIGASDSLETESLQGGNAIEISKSCHAPVARDDGLATLVEATADFWIGALAGGLTGAGFAGICKQAQFAFASSIDGEGWRRFLPLVITPCGFIFCTFMADR